MSGVRQGSHLEHLLELRDRVDAAIGEERTPMAAADARRAEQTAAAEQCAADEARAAEARREIEEIEAAAPTDLVRAWAREQGIAVGDRGRLSLDLRKQYLAATQEASA